MQGVVTLWHTLSVQQVLHEQGVDLRYGLDLDAVPLRLRIHGLNHLTAAPGVSVWRRFFQQFHNPLIYVLLVAGGTSMALQAYLDALVIFAVVLINALMGFVQEGQAEKAMHGVRSLLASRALVLRQGERQSVAADQLVPGDLVLIDSGDKVPADLRLVRCKNLRVSEAVLTGESVAVGKQVDPVAPSLNMGERSCMAYSGTMVASGQGLGVVVATGVHTEIGQIGSLVGGLQVLSTPLTRRLDQFARQISVFILGVGALSFAYGHWVVKMPAQAIFMAVVGLAVAAIPEGLPAIVTVVLAIGTRNMARQSAIVRRLPAVEALGSVTVICSDKTGTLTQNEMTAVRLVLADRELQVQGVGYQPVGDFVHASVSLDPAQAPDLMVLARCAVLCNDARIAQDAKGQWLLAGDPTEGALLTLAHKAGLQRQAQSLHYPRLDEIPFDSQHRFMAVMVQAPDGQRWLLLKGAPEVVLDLCTTQATGQPLDAAYWLAAVERTAALGQRVLALAQCPWPADAASVQWHDITRRFDMLGLVGIIDPPRPEAVAAVAECQNAGIRVKMITGDHVITAGAIGAQLGLCATGAITGEAIEAMDDEALQRCVLQTDVFARASPTHKLRLIHALQAQGHVVAMTGDGVNDAPALKAANIGVAMGHKGTEAAREAADLVLTDDHFATITHAVREGRVVFDNIKKSLMFILSTDVGEAGVILLAIFLGLALPVTSLQILWVNLITAVTLSLSLAFEPGEFGVMQRAPRSPQEPLLTKPLVLRVLFVSVLIVGVTFGAFEWALVRGDSLELARTTAVNALVFSQLVYLFHARHFTRSAFHRETLTGNPVVLWVSAIMLVLQLLFTYATPMQLLFQTEGLDAASWGLIGLLVAALFVVVELEKRVWRWRGVLRM
ncbi:cation-translocating P-type ATPase [Limnohabitans sp.]|uniref:cation-translocating P-type ATPase n=1 Tax=Limnohabitans sp. TaxID=1907725 RepID=UPI0037BE9454